MANDNQASRTFLAIVLGGIVLALVIAAYFMYGNKGDTNVKVQLPPSQEQPAETAPPAGDASFGRDATGRGSRRRSRTRSRPRSRRSLLPRNRRLPKNSPAKRLRRRTSGSRYFIGVRTSVPTPPWSAIVHSPSSVPSGFI